MFDGEHIIYNLDKRILEENDIKLKDQRPNSSQFGCIAITAISSGGEIDTKMLLDKNSESGPLNVGNNLAYSSTNNDIYMVLSTDGQSSFGGVYTAGKCRLARLTFN
jgi:hypothetical protein